MTSFSIQPQYSTSINTAAFERVFPNCSSVAVVIKVTGTRDKNIGNCYSRTRIGNLGVTSNLFFRFWDTAWAFKILHLGFLYPHCIEVLLIDIA